MLCQGRPLRDSAQPEMRYVESPVLYMSWRGNGPVHTRSAQHNETVDRGNGTTRPSKGKKECETKLNVTSHIKNPLQTLDNITIQRVKVKRHLHLLNGSIGPLL
ncbi:hypothetical protein MHYP_G00300870 [Metynnis hypsauchen]